MQITRSLSAIIVTILIAALPLAAPAQFSVGVGFRSGSRHRRCRSVSQPPAPYPNYSGLRVTGRGARPVTTGFRAPGSLRPRSASTGRPATGAIAAAAYAWNTGYWGADRRLLRRHQLRLRLLRHRLRRRLVDRQQLQLQHGGHQRHTDEHPQHLRQQDGHQQETSATTASTLATTAARVESPPDRRQGANQLAPKRQSADDRAEQTRRISRVKIATISPRSTTAGRR